VVSNAKDLNSFGAAKFVKYSAARAMRSMACTESVAPKYRQFAIKIIPLLREAPVNCFKKLESALPSPMLTVNHTLACSIRPSFTTNPAVIGSLLPISSRIHNVRAPHSNIVDATVWVHGQGCGKPRTAYP